MPLPAVHLRPCSADDLGVREWRTPDSGSLLRSKGFAHVADLQGGYDAWAAAGLPTDKGAVT